MVIVYNILNVLSNFACDNFTEKFHIYICILGRLACHIIDQLSSFDIRIFGFIE